MSAAPGEWMRFPNPSSHEGIYWRHDGDYLHLVMDGITWSRRYSTRYAKRRDALAELVPLARRMGVRLYELKTDYRRVNVYRWEQVQS